MTGLAAILLAQCCGGGDDTGSGVSTGEYTQTIILCVIVALLLLARLIWNKKGASTMSKLGKIAVVVVLAVAVVVVVAMKKNNSTLPPAPLATQPTGLPRLVDLGSTTCIPCKMMAPILEDLKKEYAGKLQVEFIDVNENPDAAKPFAVRVIPTQIFIDASGKEWRHEGFFSKEDILAKWKELGVALSVPGGGSGTASPTNLPEVKSGST